MRVNNNVQDNQPPTLSVNSNNSLSGSQLDAAQLFGNDVNDEHVANVNNNSV